MFTALRTQSPLSPFNFRVLASPKFFYLWYWCLIKFRGCSLYFLNLYMVIYIAWPVLFLLLRFGSLFFVMDLARHNMLIFLKRIFFLASCYSWTNSSACLWKKYSFLCRFLLISVLKSYGFDILKTYGEELEIVVHGIDVEVEWDKPFHNSVDI